MGAGETAEADIEPARPVVGWRVFSPSYPQTWFLALNLVGVLLKFEPATRNWSSVESVGDVSWDLFLELSVRN